jgi:DnaA-homolog protein
MQLALDLLLDPIPTLENFIVGSNAELIGHLRAPPSRTIFLWGESGSGKTHLLKAMAARTGLGSELRSELGLGIYATADALPLIDSDALPTVLCLDQLESIAAEHLDKLFALQNLYRASSDKLLLIASRLAPKAITDQLNARDDVSSRLAWGLTLQVKELSDIQKQAALDAFFEHRGTEISADVVPYLLTRHSRNIKDLAGLADQIDRYAFSQKRALTLALLRQFQNQTNA